MSRLYDTIEPSVIDELMLKQAVEEQGPRGEAGRIAKSEGIDFGDVLSLRLDFKNILKIDNLWSFVNLTTLQLDNNIIERIEGLDLLVNLEWLDLSFNNIEVLEGLDKLTKLKDLTLYNNRISKIENMDNITDLHVFSLGNNNLKQLDNVLYLRRFKNLRTLNLSSNPFCEDVSYKEYVIAHLPNLVYLDFRLVDSTAREVAMEKYKYSIEELVHDETVALKKQEEIEAKEKERQMHKALIDYSNTSDVSLLEVMMKEIVEKITKLWDSLMGLEMQLVDQLEVSRDTYDIHSITEFSMRLRNLRICEPRVMMQ
ncbi:Leucine-rich repeat-containing protein 48 [Exaiptasia diaphana]|nr:Leucine-rich repeat-containing protein 48 [Exaiptasia diaphana]